MQVRIPTVLMRGGTSRGLFFMENHLPPPGTVRDRVILAAYGSPDPNRRQIDGIGGATSTTNKTAIISVAAEAAYDVVYNFGQVNVDQPLVDYRGNCGNLSAAVGPFAVDQGLVPVQEPVTTVRILQKNTGKLIVAEVPVREGVFDEEGDFRIAGVPGSGSKVTLHFHDPAGGMTGKLFPTGNPRDRLEVPGLGVLEVTVVDAGNPAVVVRARDLGLQGTEIEQFDSDQALRSNLEMIRGQVAVLLGLVSRPEDAAIHSQAFPKIAVVSPPQDYLTIAGSPIKKGAIHLVARAMTLGSLHRAYAVTGAIYTAGAAMVPGTVVAEALGANFRGDEPLRIGHPSGIIEVGARVELQGQFYHYLEAIIGRTARRIMEGHILVPAGLFPHRGPHRSHDTRLLG